MKIIIKLLFSLLTTLNLMIHGMKQGVLFWFCPHYYNHANREKIAKQLEAKGIKNLEDL